MKTDITWGGITYWAFFGCATIVLLLVDVFAFRRSRVLGFVLFIPVVSIMVFLQQVGISLFGERSSEMLIGVIIGAALAVGLAGMVGGLLA